jgi:predicted TIM-barrel fold metal-dependent hydrolase
LRDSGGSGVVAVVAIEVDAGADDPAAETRWLDQEAGQHDLPHAIVGFVDLDSEDAEAVLLRHLASPAFRGVRHRSATDFLASPRFERRLARLEHDGLLCMLGLRPGNTVTTVRDLAGRHPGVRLLVSHMGLTVNADRSEPGFFYHWRDRARVLAEADNIHCQVMGLAIADHDWTVESFRPWVLTAIEIFGPERCVFGSHWPHEMLFSSHRRLLEAYVEIASELTAAEQERLFSGNALDLYRIAMPR